MCWVNAETVIHPHVLIEVERAVPIGIHDPHESIGDLEHRFLEIFRWGDAGLHDINKLFPLKPSIPVSITRGKQQAPPFLERPPQHLRVLWGIATRPR